ncbi:MAG: hypothetical protein IBX45_12380, partial [Campylobacterales bacterium]|nr:hypothetical protein [Campylobacterales bacterium]
MTHISWEALALMALPLVMLGIVMARWGFSIKPLGVASVRMVLQLLAIGYVVTPEKPIFERNFLELSSV